MVDEREPSEPHVRIATGSVRTAVEQRFTSSGPIVAPKGDPSCPRELPRLASIVGRTVVGVVIGFLLCLAPIWLGVDLLQKASVAHPSVFARTGSLAPVSEIFGGDPGIYGFWFVATLLVVLLHSGLERAGRNAWIPALLIALVGGLAFASPPDISLMFTGWDLGGALGDLRGFAAVCLPERWPLVLTVGAFGVLAARKGDSALLLLAMIVSFWLVFELHVAREAALSQVLSSAESNLSIRLQRTGSTAVADAQDAVTLVRSLLYLRDAADFWFLLLPAWVMSTRD